MFAVYALCVQGHTCALKHIMDNKLFWLLYCIVVNNIKKWKNIQYV